MNSSQVAKYWDDNADHWTKMVRAGYDVWRDYVNMPAFLEMLPDIEGLHGVDIGCGEGANTREFPKQGATITTFDASPKFVRYASEEAMQQHLPIRHLIASALEIPFGKESFDFATATMSMMDMPSQECAFAEIHRILKPDGFFQFSVVHPMFNSFNSGWELTPDGRKNGFIVRGYFKSKHGEIEEWTFSSAPEEMRKETPPFKVPRFDRTVSEWLNLVIDTGFIIERVEEPYPKPEVRHHFTKYTDDGIIPFSFVVRCNKSS